MVNDQTRRNFFRTAPLAAASLSLTDKLLFASTASSAGAQTAEAAAHEPFQSFPAQTIESLLKSLQAAPARNNSSARRPRPSPSS